MPFLADLFVDSKQSVETAQQLERQFFDCLRLKNGVYKTTYAHRLDDVNAWAVNYLPGTRPLRVLDLGISSGTSTLEWVESMEEANVDCHMTGIDLTIGGAMMSFGARMHAVLDGTNWPMLLEVNGKWFSNPPRKKDVLSHPLSISMIKSALFLWRQRHQRSGNRPVDRVFGLQVKTRPISLVTPRLVSHPNVVVREADILSDSWIEGKYHVVRAANLLNKKYFDEGAIAHVLNSLRQHIVADGTLIVCRTDDSRRINDASIFRVDNEGRFTVTSTMNDGSEIQSLVLGLPVLGASHKGET